MILLRIGRRGVQRLEVGPLKVELIILSWSACLDVRWAADPNEGNIPGRIVDLWPAS